MTSSNMKIDINVKDINFFKNLVSLLEKHFDDLPKELQCSLKDISDDNLNEIDGKELDRMFPEIDYKLVEVDYPHDTVLSANRILKKVVYFNGEEECEDFPETFSLKYDGKTIIEW